jgi:phosphate starvation-inducible PhoH-like protein
MSKKQSRYSVKQNAKLPKYMLREEERKGNVHRLPTSFHLLPKNEKQDDLIDAIKECPITVTMGCAGTGKTYCSAGTVAQLFMKGKYKKIVLTRANVPTGKSLGHFPGTVEEKMTPWLMPMLEVLTKAFGKGKYEYMLSKGEIEIQPIETIRGRSYENALVLVDEAQNLNIEEIKAITTRIGENTKLVLMGDPAQSDVSNGKDLIRFARKVNQAGILLPVIEFGVDDIVRSDIVADLVRLFIEEGM